VPNPRLARLNKIMLWVATGFVVALAAFPNYVGGLIGGADGPPPAVTASLSTRTYAIDGMTCEGCASHVEKALADLEGVASAEVSYADKLARVYVTSGAEVSEAAVIGGVGTAGYRARSQQGGP
jgi:copper chaperone CopZ